MRTADEPGGPIGSVAAVPGRREGGRGVLVRVGLLALFAVGLIVAVPSGFGLFWFVPYAGVGSLLIVRRRGASIGPILLGIGWALACATITLNVTVEMYTDGTLSALNAVLSVVTGGAGLTAFYLFAVLAIVFPSGHLPTGRWGTLARVAIAAGLAVLLASLVTPTINVGVWGSSIGQSVANPISVMPELGMWRVVTPDTVALPMAALMAVAVISLVARYRRSWGTERQQMKWLASALGFMVAAVVGGYTLGVLSPALGATGLIWLGAAAAFPLVPVAIGLAILRYRLYEIDRIVSRTIGWLVVTALLATVFSGAVVGLQALLAGFTQGQTLAVAASTLLAAAAFQPVRRRVQHAVDRRFNRARLDAERVVRRFAGHARDEVDLAPLRAELLATVDDAVAPATLGMWLREREQPV